MPRLFGLFLLAGLLSSCAIMPYLPLIALGLQATGSALSGVSSLYNSYEKMGAPTAPATQVPTAVITPIPVPTPSK